LLIIGARVAPSSVLRPLSICDKAAWSLPLSAASQLAITSCPQAKIKPVKFSYSKSIYFDYYRAFKWFFELFMMQRRCTLLRLIEIIRAMAVNQLFLKGNHA
jgi:hypothetical protein